MIRKTLTTLVIAAALTGCGDDDPAGPTPVSSEFQLTVAGALTETATGPAYFGADVNDDGEPVFALLMGQDTSRHLVILARAGSTRPGTGTYEIEDPTVGTGWNALHMVSDGDELLGMFMGDSGTLTITESSADVLRGTLEFEAYGFVGIEEDTVQVTATFTAAPASQASGAPALSGGLVRR